LFNLPTTAIEDLYQEVREHAEHEARDFGLLGYQVEIKPIEEVVQTSIISRGPESSSVAAKYQPKKEIQPFFKENRAG